MEKQPINPLHSPVAFSVEIWIRLLKPSPTPTICHEESLRKKVHITHSPRSLPVISTEWYFRMPVVGWTTPPPVRPIQCNSEILIHIEQFSVMDCHGSPTACLWNRWGEKSPRLGLDAHFQNPMRHYRPHMWTALIFPASSCWAALESEDVYIQSGLQKDTQRKQFFVSLDLLHRSKMTFPVSVSVLLQEILH